MITKRLLEELTYEIIGASIEVHKTLGSGLLENVYHVCLKELFQRNIIFQSELKVPINYKGKLLDAELRCDLLVENCIVVELKSVAEMNKIFEAQLPI